MALLEALKHLNGDGEPCEAVALEDFVVLRHPVMTTAHDVLQLIGTTGNITAVYESSPANEMWDEQSSAALVCARCQWQFDDIAVVVEEDRVFGQDEA